MGDLAKDLTDELHVPVTDATGLEGPLSDIFAALRSIGLKLDKTKEPLPVIVIDHAEKKPSEN